MKEYLLRFWNQSGDGSYDMDPDKMTEGMKAWQGWIAQIAQQGRLISTKPINWAGKQIHTSKTTDAPVIIDGLMVTGYMLCKGNRSEVENWSATCPILDLEHGFVEIREIAPFEM